MRQNWAKCLKWMVVVVMTAALCVPFEAEARRKSKKKAKKPKISLVSSGKIKDHPLDDPENRFVTVDNPFGAPTEGLDGRNIALWQSHGRIFDNAQGVWKFQRPRLFGTVEDLFTQGFVVPYIAPMLENAGAYVMLPRERDTAPWEVIADEEGSPEGKVHFSNGKQKWEATKLGSGFALRRPTLTDGENPFTMGRARKVKTVEAKDAHRASKAEWFASLPQAGKRAVYVSYPSFDNSAPDARYVVNHRGGQTAVTVNQRMGGGTWVYIGSYDFPEGEQELPVVELSNISSQKGGKAVVAADAVRIGGGMGNVARAETDAYGNLLTEPFTSNSPRFNEGARYWLQWAGMPEKVYTPNASTNDYKDDFMSRAHWVNYLAGGSKQLPDSAGLGIPVDLALAIHSDAGRRTDSTTVGTLAIFSSDDGHPLGNGRNRADCRDLANAVSRQIISDVQRLYSPTWGDRGVKDQKYYECRAPKVPSAIIETLSHQNLEDMKLGLDPRFRFDVSRAVYKGVLRYLGKLYGKKVTVQPLPVEAFAIDYIGAGHYRLRWSPKADPLEPSALPASYIVEHRGEPSGAFQPIDMVADTTYIFEVPDTDLHSFRIVAVNAGGRSFPSETLALADKGDGSEPEVLVVNAFTRLSAPDTFSEGPLSGFDFEGGEGTDYIEDIITTGPQFQFHQADEFVNNDLPGYGGSRGNLERTVTGGNTFDYPSLHGLSLVNAGRSFTSSSRLGFERADTLSALPPLIDVILGTEREISPQTIRRLSRHLDRGGQLLLSGAHPASACAVDTTDFAARYLHVRLVTDDAALTGMADGTAGTPMCGSRYDFARGITETSYPVGRVDALRPANHARTLLRYSENQLGVAIGSHQTAVIAFPIETVVSPEQRDMLFAQILQYLSGR